MNTQQAVGLTNALSQVLARHLPPCLADLLDATTQALKEQRIRANSNSEEQTFTDFIRLCTSQRERIISETLKVMQLRLANPNSQAPVPSSSNEDWNLVDDAEVDELLDMRRLVRTLREPLGSLEWRNCARLNRVNACIGKDLDNPLSLEFLVRTLQARLHLRQQPVAVREVFYSAAHVLGSTLLPCFNQLDELFKQFQIEPLSAPQTEPSRPPRSTASVHSIAAAPYQAIQQLRAVESNNPVPAANPSTIDLAALQQAIATLQTLTPAQHGWSANSFVQQLHQAGAQLSPRQYTDAGLVAELFQHLEQHKVIAAGVKPALRRLMTPVAQAAILEPQAFADPSHPVRATLDKLMRLCDFSEPSNPALEQRVEQLIDGIVSNYRGDSAVFSDCDQQLEQLLAVQQRAYSNNAERVMQYHRGRDKLEVAREHVAQELAQLFGQQAPQVLLEWLEAGWRELLVHGLLRQGEHGTEWQDDFNIIRQLNLWLHAETAGATDHIERDYEVDHVLELLRRRTESLLPGQYRHMPILQKLQRQLRGAEPVEM
nr:DUF1631 family protein [Pseudomonas sp.]